MIRLRSRRRKTDGLPEVPLTPLIDTALTLLIIFMVTTPMMQNALKIDLPKGKAQEVKIKQQEIIVYVDKSGKIVCENKEFANHDELVAFIKEQTKNAMHTVVVVKADEGVSYGAVYALVDHVKVAGGIEYVALAARAA